MTKSTRVLQRKLDIPSWLQADFPVGSNGFEYEALLAMTGSDYIQSISLDERFTVICDEEGRSKNLPVMVSVPTRRYGVIPIFGEFAVVRSRRIRLHGGCTASFGLLPGDEDIIRSSFAWNYVI